MILFTNGMQPHQWMRTAAAEIAQNEIVLISSDNKKITIPLKIAQKTPTLASLLNNFQEGHEKLIPFREIDSKPLYIIADIMWFIYDHSQLEKKALFGALAQKVQLPHDQIIPVLLACNFLEFTPGISLIAQKISLDPQLTTQIAQLIQKNLLSYDTVNEIAKKYYLMNEKDFPGINREKVSFSLRDYLEYLPRLIYKDRISNETLDLKKLRLNNLDGLQNLPNINTIVYLVLFDNHLTELPETAFQKFNNLTALSLANNHLTHLPSSIFQNLKKLERLYLSENQLSELPPDVFSNLSNLQELFLNNNKLTKLPGIIFKNLINLNRLDLDNNMLSELPDNIFQGLSNLKHLDLMSNQLSQLPSNIFHGLNYLEYIGLAGNPIKYLPTALFQNLPNLGSIYFEFDKKLSHKDMQQFRKALPGIILRY